MSKRPDDKGLMNEVLPDPTAAAGEPARGSPRDRATAHLKRLMAAAAGVALQLPGLAGADATPPPGKDSPGKKNGKEARPEKAKPPERPPEPEVPPYGVVDPMPPPYLERAGEPGFLRVESNPPATIAIDGKATGLTTPQRRIELAPGVHVITLAAPAPGATRTFTVEIRPGATVRHVQDLRPSKPAVRKKP